jgi:hypothetical protein
MDRSLASGLNAEGTFTPDQFYAGEADVVSTQGVLAKGIAFVQYQVLALAGDLLRPYDKEGRASGTLTFSGVGTAADTITVNGVVITLRAAADPALDEVTIGGTAALTAANFVTFVNDNSARLGVTATLAGAVVTLKAIEPGVDGDDITTVENGTGTAFGAATLTGGNALSRPYAILPHAVDTTIAGTNAETDTPILIGGAFNFDVLVADGATYDELRQAFAFGNSKVIIQKLF